MIKPKTFSRLNTDGYNAPQLPTIVIALSCDSNYAPHTATTITSLLSNANGDRCLDIIVLDGGLSYRDRSRMKTLEELHPRCSIRLIDLQHTFQDIPRHVEHYGPANYFRLLLASKLKKYSRVLYLDSDIVVLADIAALFDTDLGPFCIGACEDMGMKPLLDEDLPTDSVVGAMPYREYFSNHLGLNEENQKRYFNSGVMLMDLSKLREGKYEDKFISFLKDHDGRFCFADQDVLNHFFPDNYLSLNLSWNMQIYDLKWAERLPDETNRKFKTAYEAPHIVHFTSIDNKPWLFPDTDFAHRYREYFGKTPWH